MDAAREIMREERKAGIRSDNAIPSEQRFWGIGDIFLLPKPGNKGTFENKLKKQIELAEQEMAQIREGIEKAEKEKSQTNKERVTPKKPNRI